MNIEISRRVTRHVRGLHLAVLTVNSGKAYHGHRAIVEAACMAANRGQYGKARAMLKDARHNAIDRTNYTKLVRFTPAAAKLLRIKGRATTKYVEVALSQARIDELKPDIWRMRIAANGNTLKTLDAALEALAGA